MAAGIVLIREAGGFVSDLDGGTDMLTKGHIIAGNEMMMRRTLELLRGLSAALPISHGFR